MENTKMITVIYDEVSDRPTVSGRELHEALEVKTAYKDWFPRMCEYGFTEGKDFNPLKKEQVRDEGGRQVTREILDHQLTIPMAKELCMLQRNEKGKEFRRYFIQVEEKWNSPEAVMARALKIANSKIGTLETKVGEQAKLITNLDNENKVLSSEVLEWADRNIINAAIRRFATRACNNNFAAAWVEFKKELLYKYSISLNARITNFLNGSGKKTKPKTLDMLDDSELASALKTIVSMCREKNVDISDIISNHRQ